MYRIMVVDDEDYILKALNRVLATRPDWEVETYTDAATALRRARTTVFDAVITGCRTWTALRCCRSCGPCSRIPSVSC